MGKKFTYVVSYFVLGLVISLVLYFVLLIGGDFLLDFGGVSSVKIVQPHPLYDYTIVIIPLGIFFFMVRSGFLKGRKMESESTVVSSHRDVFLLIGVLLILIYLAYLILNLL
ncbi:hypothetical protein D4R99_00545 [bacterium]|nr:MAG: hypothetical protein D4R99_00545 [bacterium]